ncbi:MAG: ClpXP protease specificity-enhancing factor SspB [Myxococcales bacterium]
MMDARSEEKKRQLERALEKGRVMIHLDARRPGVIVPERFKADFHLRLNLSLRFDPPDLTVGEWGVRETLSFGGARFTVAVPWSAIFAITGAERSEAAWMYAEDMPRELFEEAARQFGLTGAEVDTLREEAKSIDRVEVPPPEQAPEARRRAFQVVKAVTGEFELPEGGEAEAAPAEEEKRAGPTPAPVLAPAPAPAPAPALTPVETETSSGGPPQPPDGDGSGPRRGHLRLVK